MKMWVIALVSLLFSASGSAFAQGRLTLETLEPTNYRTGGIQPNQDPSRGQIAADLQLGLVEKKNEVRSTDAQFDLSFRLPLDKDGSLYTRFGFEFAAVHPKDLRDDRSTPLFDNLDNPNGDNPFGRAGAHETIGMDLGQVGVLRFCGTNGCSQADVRAYLEVGADQKWNGPTGVDFRQDLSALLGLEVGALAKTPMGRFEAGPYYRDQRLDPHFAERADAETGLGRDHSSFGGLVHVDLASAMFDLRSMPPELFKNVRLVASGTARYDDFKDLEAWKVQGGLSFRVTETSDVQVVAMGEDDAQAGRSRGIFVTWGSLR